MSETTATKVEKNQLRDYLLERYSSSFSSSSRNYLVRAVDAVIDGRVKKHVFTPSNRVIFTVVGRSGDEFVDAEKPFCSCQHFFFVVQGGRDQACYHLIALSIAQETGELRETMFHDEEFGDFLKLLSSDLLSRSSGAEKKFERPISE